MDCSPPDSSVHEILEARILEQVAISWEAPKMWKDPLLLPDCKDWEAGTCLFYHLFSSYFFKAEKRKKNSSVLFLVWKEQNLYGDIILLMGTVDLSV